MKTSLLLYIALVLVTGLVRLIELMVSRRHQSKLAGQGFSPIREPHFGAMVMLHLGILLGCLLEAWLRQVPPPPVIWIPMLMVLVAANCLRWWVIAALGRHWNVQIVASMPLGVVVKGPFHWIRHPNYVAVFVEMLALPLVYGAWITALLGSALHVAILSSRIRREEAVLLGHPEYRARMADKPRFIPRIP
jgi:methyltransferase